MKQDLQKKMTKMTKMIILVVKDDQAPEFPLFGWYPVQTNLQIKMSSSFYAFEEKL